jgi:hypothetical protein
MKRTVFARKQRAIRDAMRIGDQIIWRNRRMLLASTFNAWKLRAGVYHQVARRFQAALEVTLRWAWGQWRAQLATQVGGHYFRGANGQWQLLSSSLADGKLAKHLLLLHRYQQAASGLVDMISLSTSSM